jgi:general stress protein YciG
MPHETETNEIVTEEQSNETPKPQEQPQQPPRKRRGFAAMDPRLVSELASRGGKAAQRAGTAHRFSSEEARVAGRKGGIATGQKRRQNINPERESAN